MILPPFELQWIPCSTFRKHPAQWKEDVCSVLLKGFEAEPRLGPLMKGFMMPHSFEESLKESNLLWDTNETVCLNRFFPFVRNAILLLSWWVLIDQFRWGTQCLVVQIQLYCYNVKNHCVLWLAWLGCLQLWITRIFKFAGQSFGPSNMFLLW